MNADQLVKGLEVWSVAFSERWTTGNPYLRHGRVVGRGAVYTTVVWDDAPNLHYQDKESTSRMARRVWPTELEAWQAFRASALGEEQRHRDLARRHHDAALMAEVNIGALEVREAERSST